jgi:hypothetical protein
MAKNPNDNKKIKESFKTPKSGSSNSKIDFIKEGVDFLSDIDLEDDESEVFTPEDLDDPELSDYSEESEDDFIIEEIAEEVKEVKTGKVTIISKKIPVKKPVENPVVEKEVNKLIKDLAPDVSPREIADFLEVTPAHREQFVNGEMQFLSRKNVSKEDKKEFMAKLDEIVSTDEVSKANSAFVLKWLKTRNNT